MTLFIWPIGGGAPVYYFSSDNVHDCATEAIVFRVRDRKLFTIEGDEAVYWIRDAKVYDDEACTGAPKFYLGD